MMRSLIVSLGADPNGEAMRFKAAAERHGGAQIRAVTRSTHSYKHLPADILLAGNGGAVKRLWAQADVIHLNNRVEAFDQFDDGHGKPVLLHHHGATFRTDPAPLLKVAAARGWTQAASTLDLVEIAPDVVSWLPTAYDLNALATLRQQHRREDDGVVRIAHAPTFRTLKSTDALIRAVNELQAEGVPVELDLIQQERWSDCLRRKAAADILVDQLLLGYGCNAIEAWGMGLPVIAGVDPERAAWVNHPIPASTRGRMLAEFGGALPFYEASEDTLVDALRAFVTDPELRDEYALRGMEHAAQFHGQLVSLERLVELYQRAIGSARNTAEVAA
jgi:hypothetical protein